MIEQALPWIAAALAIVLCLWVALAALARRLTPRFLRDLRDVVPACARLAWRLRADKRVPRSAKVALVLAALWVASPIDLIPEFLPVIGQLDDVVVVAVALRYAARRVPGEVLLAAWPAEPRLLERVLGRDLSR